MADVIVQVVVPAVSRDEISIGLRNLTRALADRGIGRADAFGLGGPDGYGVDYENDTFLMHPYCWCEQESCRWCSEDACGCPHPEVEHYLDGERVPCWSAANRILLGKFADHRPSNARERRQWNVIIAERDRRLVRVYPERTHTCTPHGLMADRPRGASWLPTQSAPNFWHKASGLRVWWYKYIGRDIKTHPNVVVWPSEVILRDCMDSLTGSRPS
jgi:hypothetical protein